MVVEIIPKHEKGRGQWASRRRCTYHQFCNREYTSFLLRLSSALTRHERGAFAVPLLLITTLALSSTFSSSSVRAFSRLLYPAVPAVCSTRLVASHLAFALRPIHHQQTASARNYSMSTSNGNVSGLAAADSSSMKAQQPEHPTLLIPGPIEFDDEVLRAMSHYRYAL